MLKLIPVFIFIILSFSASSQITGPEQDCIDAIYVDQMVYVQNNSYQGTGNVEDIPSGSSCLQNQENNSVWYSFSIVVGGVLEFIINPNAGDDYDFALYNITGASCADILSGSVTPVRCNYAFTNDSTGLHSGYDSTSQGSGGLAFLAPVNVSFGETYALIIDNFSSTQSGYTLDFSSSTSILGSPSDSVVANPHIISGSPCGGGVITLDAGISGGTGPFIVSWTGGIPVDSPDSAITSVTIPGTGNYSFTVTVVDTVRGDTATASININPSGLPFEADAGNDTNL